MRRGQRQIEQVKIKMALQLDDRTFQLMLSETQVIQTKDHTKWNYDILVDLFEGPFLGPRRIEEAFRLSKFGKRLMAFWHPSSRRFSEIRKTKVCGLTRWPHGGVINNSLVVQYPLDQAWVFDYIDTNQNSRRNEISAL